MTDLHAEAIAQGYKDEVCSKCGALFLAHIHFVRCEAKPCPMVSPEGRTMLERMLAETAVSTAKQGGE